MLYSRFGSLPSFRPLFMGFPLGKNALFALTCALALAAAGCGGDDAKTAEDVPADAIAVIGETEVPRAEFDALMRRAEKNYKAQKRPFPKVGTPEYQDLKTRAVAYLTQRYQFRVEAEELGIEVTDKDVDKKLADLKKELFQGDEKKFRAALAREGLTEEQAREEVRDRLIQERLYKKVTEDVKVTDADIEKYYEKNKAQFTQPATRNVRHILVKEKSRADDIHAELENGASFASLARRYSQDTTTKKQGGKLPVTKGSTVPPFDKTAFSLEKGEVSEPVKTQFGWHIIEALSAVKPEKVTPLSQVKDSIKNQLLQQKKNEALDSWLKQLKKKYDGETVYAAGFEPPKTDTGETKATTSKQ